jgi:cell shape-determining protein MreC
MKKYSLTKKANSRRTLLIRRLGVVIVSVAILFLLYIVVPQIARTVVAVVWYPFDMVRIWVAESGNSLPQYLRDRDVLVNEIDALKAEVATQRGSENTVRKLQIENDIFREQIGAVKEPRILARVIGRPNQLPYDMLMLDRGTDHGVALNMPVFVGNDQVIGFVSKVQRKTALITLVTTAGFTSSAYVIGPNIHTYAEGVGGGVLRVRIPQGILLQVGDLVILPAVDSGVYGAVSLVESVPTQPEQFGYVSSDVPLQSLYYVSIGVEPMVTHSYEEAEAVIAEVSDDLFKVELPPGVLVTPETATTSATTSPPIPIPGVPVVNQSTTTL